MWRKHQISVVELVILSFVVSLFLIGQLQAAPTIQKIVISPSQTEFPVGTDAIALTVKASGKDLTFEWKLQGPGVLEEPTTESAVFYLPPETIDKESERVMISVKVTDAQNEESVESIIFKIVNDGAAQAPPPGKPEDDYAFLVSDRAGLFLVNSEGTAKKFSDLAGPVEVYEDKIFVLSTGQRRIYELSQKGHILREIPIKDEDQIPSFLNFVLLPNMKFALLDNRNDKVYFIDSQGKYERTVNILEQPDNGLQNVEGTVVNNILLVSENGRGQIIKIDLATYKKTIFRDLSDGTCTWISDIHYHDGTYYTACAPRDSCNSTVIGKNLEEDLRIFCILGIYGGNITAISVKDDAAFLAINKSGKIYKVSLSTDEAEVFCEGFEYPEDIELLSF